MPILTREELQTQKLPWMDIDDFEFIVLGRAPGQGSAAAPPAASANGHAAFWGAPADPHVVDFRPTTPRERIVVIDGEVQVECELGRFHLSRRDFFEVPQSGAKVTNVGTSTAELARIAGHWTQIIRNEICLFRPDRPCDYHYHDGDEYWMVFRGHFTLNYDGQEYAMRPGLMLAAGMGFEHGAAQPEEHFEAVVMAMQLSGQRRDGHLVRDMHGAPVKNRAVPDEAMRPHRQAAHAPTP